jgi:hypothetical protein
MSINVNVGNLIPTEVVEVGNEISVNQLAAITAATDPSATNPFSTAGHTHVIANVTGLQTALDAKANTSHTHPTSSITNLDSILANKANITHGHGIGDINLLAETLAGKASLVHTHVIADTTGLQTALDGKSDTTHLHTGVYSPISHLHTGVYAPVIHAHAIADTTGLQTALDGKASTTHTHSQYATLTGATFSGEISAPQVGNLLNTDLVIDSYNDTGAGTHYYHKFTPFDGKFVLAPNGGGLVFPDATVQSTSAYSKAQTDSYVSTLTGWINDRAVITGANNFVGDHTHKGSSEWKPTSGAIPAISITNETIGVFNGMSSAGYRITTSGYTTSGFLSTWVEGGDMMRGLVLNENGLTWDNTKTFNWLPSTGFTFNDKVTIPSPTVDNAKLNIGSINSTANITNSVAGDVWIGTWQMAYKTANGTLVYGAATNAQNVFGSPQIIDTTNNTYPALRVTQKGTANAIVVEDSTTPDTSSFIVNNDGRVYVNYNPATATDTVADFRVTKKAGSSYAAFFDSQGVNDGGSTVQISNAGSGSPLICSGGITRLYGGVQIGSTGVQIERINVGFTAPTPATYPYEFEIRMNGNTFRIPCRII